MHTSGSLTIAISSTWDLNLHVVYIKFIQSGKHYSSISFRNVAMNIKLLVCVEKSQNVPQLEGTKDWIIV